MIGRWASAMIVIALFASGCGEEAEDAVVTPELLELGTNQLVIGLEHYVTAEGVRRAHLQADSAFFEENASVVDLRTVRATFFDRLGEVSSVLTSETGTYDWETGGMTATGDVVVLDPDRGRRIETQVLYYDRDRERIWSDQPSRMYEEDGTVIEGESFESDPGIDDVNLESARLVRPGSAARAEP